MNASLTEVHITMEPGPAASELTVSRRTGIGTACGIAGAIGMAVPIVLYDWISPSHSALELPMAAAAWLFGLEHFAQNGYLWGPIVIGTLGLVALWLAVGAVFGGITDRYLRIRSLPDSLAVGLAWGFVSFVFFWYTLLPIARGGAPFMLTYAGLFVAPFWVSALGFALLGLMTGATYWAARAA